MVFWILAALFTLAASVAVMFPFLRPQKAAAEVEHDLAVYRDQLFELESEVKRGLISNEDGAEARAEIGRRIIKLSADEKSAAAHKGFRRTSRFVAAAAILTVPLLSWGLYSVLGSPGTPGMPLAERLQMDPAQASVAELIGRAETHLAINPQDIRGWETLAPVYMRLGRYQDAVKAYRQIIALGGSKANLEALLGEAFVGLSGGVVTSEAEAVFQKALELEPKEPRARFFLSLGLAQEGKLDEARMVWSEMVAELPQDSPWRAVAQEALTGDAGGAEANVPAQADVEQGNTSGQQDMIEGMVAGLDARLKDNPNDPEGWQRLVRSYVVLKRLKEAQDALERGIDALGKDGVAAKELEAFAKEQGISRHEGEL